ncbi:MAG: hypothetical protein HQL77_16710 [Magnetococcales bacterium]|nr:hypothetical protein [Magnetococcales bacterium]
MQRPFVPMILIAVPLTLWSCQTKKPEPGPSQSASPGATQVPAKPTPGEEKNDKEGKVKVGGKSFIGMSMEELQRTLGPPKGIIDSTITGRAASEAWVYPSSGNASCLDTYVVGDASKKVEDYFCR